MIPVEFSKNLLEEGFLFAIEVVLKTCTRITDNNTKFVKDYCVYVLGSTYIKSYGVTWLHKGVKYSAKVSDGVFKDLYIIKSYNFKNIDIISTEVDKDTLEVISFYSNNGFTKLDNELQINLESRQVVNTEGLTFEELETLSNANFPYIDCIYGISEKSYGKAVEFFIPWEYMNAPAILNEL